MGWHDSQVVGATKANLRHPEFDSQCWLKKKINGNRTLLQKTQNNKN